MCNIIMIIPRPCTPMTECMVHINYMHMLNTIKLNLIKTYIERHAFPGTCL